MSASEHRVSLLTRPGCCLCDDARTVLARISADLGVTVEERDITRDPADFARYADWVPVVLLDGAEHAVFRVDERRLRRDLGS